MPRPRTLILVLAFLIVSPANATVIAAFEVFGPAFDPQWESVDPQSLGFEEADHPDQFVFQIENDIARSGFAARYEIFGPDGSVFRSNLLLAGQSDTFVGNLPGTWRARATTAALGSVIFDLEFFNDVAAAPVPAPVAAAVLAVGLFGLRRSTLRQASGASRSDRRRIDRRT